MKTFIIALGLSFCAFARSESVTNQKSTIFEDSISQRVANRKVAIKKYIPKLRELQKVAYQSSEVFLIQSGLNKDAGPFLNPKVRWIDESSNKAAKAAYEKYILSLSASKVAQISLPALVVEKLKSIGPDYYKKSNEFELKSIDFGWIKELQKYDTWNIEENSPLAYLDSFDFINYPIPDVLPFIAWTKLRSIASFE